MKMKRPETLNEREQDHRRCKVVLFLICQCAICLLQKLCSAHMNIRRKFCLPRLTSWRSELKVITRSYLLPIKRACENEKVDSARKRIAEWMCRLIDSEGVELCK
ncbi:hypothetical protein CEXT_703811 [Caerostris extrusa]|uniref:Uncharacterized protein n=1 Tax=Caerostris extrusa TaxID=172846 RepID=A0AAV4P7P8_CAEEX|nr:hypothetical protein CEXT_703811 [Caerostris extrusa]